MVKGAADRTVTLGLVALGHVIPGIAVASMVAPPLPAAWPFIVASTVIHWGYYLFLNLAYRWGDLSFAYPVARGAAPVLVALGAIHWAGESLSPLAWIGVGAVSGGILILAAVRHADKRGTAAALATAATIAAYSIADGLGIRASGSPLGYIAWLYIAEVFVAGFVLVSFRRRLAAIPPRLVAIGFAGGLISCLAYGLALYAQTLAPLAIVSALRETSVVFAALIGVVIFSERPVARRVAASAVVAAGVIVLTLA